MVRMGIRKGDRVAIYLPRTPEQVVAMLAATRIGAVHTLVCSGLTLAFLPVFRGSGPRLNSVKVGKGIGMRPIFAAVPSSP